MPRRKGHSARPLGDSVHGDRHAVHARRRLERKVIQAERQEDPPARSSKDPGGLAGRDCPARCMRTLPDRCHGRAVRGVTVHWGRLCGFPGRPARNRVRRDLITRRWPGLDYHLFIPCPGKQRIIVPGAVPPRRAVADPSPASTPRQLRHPAGTGDNAAGRGEFKLHRCHGTALAQPPLPAGNTTE
jgi:hypothetical protein